MSRLASGAVSCSTLGLEINSNKQNRYVLGPDKSIGADVKICVSKVFVRLSYRKACVHIRSKSIKSSHTQYDGGVKCKKPFINLIQKFIWLPSQGSLSSGKPLYNSVKNSLLINYNAEANGIQWFTNSIIKYCRAG